MTNLLGGILATLEKKGYSYRGPSGGEYHVDCPFCGKEQVAGQTHAQVGSRGFKCFVCGKGVSLTGLAKYLEVTDFEKLPPPPKPDPGPPKPPPSWRSWDRERYRQEYEYANYWAWREYKNVPPYLVDECEFRYGRLVNASCSHDRYIVPIFDGEGKLANLRGRAVDCDCPKWLGAAADYGFVNGSWQKVSSSWKLNIVPLYNVDRVKQGSVVFVVENPVDAVLATSQMFYLLMKGLAAPYLQERKGQFSYGAVATLSVSYWQDSWMDSLRELNPARVIVMFDNDLPGNGGARNRKEMVAAWKKCNKRNKIPKANGISLTNELLKAGLPAALFDWKDAPPKTDLGDLLQKESARSEF